MAIRWACNWPVSLFKDVAQNCRITLESNSKVIRSYAPVDLLIPNEPTAAAATWIYGVL